MPTEKDQKHSALANVAFGSISGLCVGILFQPLEIIKNNIIINPKQIHHLPSSSLSRYLTQNRQFVIISSQIQALEGFKGFWRGTSTMIWKLTLSSAIYYSSLQELQSIFQTTNINNQIQYFWSSFLARIFSSALTNPLQVVRTRIEVIGFNEYKGVIDGLQQVYQKEGIKGYSSGLLSTMLKEGPFAGIYFAIYSSMKTQLNAQQGYLSLQSESMISGMTAGVIATIMTNPIDVIRTRLQYHKEQDILKYKSIYDGFAKIYNKEGIYGYFRGLGPKIIKKPLSNTVSWIIYESLGKHFLKTTN